MMNEQEYSDAVMAMFEPATQCEAMVTYIPEGDCLECVSSAEDYYAERIDGRVTVYVGRESKEIVGLVIKGWKCLLQRLAKHYSSFPAIIQGKTAKLEYILVAHVLTLPKKEKRQATRTERLKFGYSDLLAEANRWNVSVPVGGR
jgi:hypothetical protein